MQRESCEETAECPVIGVNEEKFFRKSADNGSVPLRVRVPAGQAGIFLNLEPVVGAILGVALLHEVLGVFAIAGGVLIVLAAAVVSLQGDVPAAN